jgi:outer membrane protein
MKSVFKICVLAVLLFSAGFAKAQAPKFGHIDFQALLQIMPESSKAEKDLGAFQKELEDAFGTMQKEYNTKLLEYNSKLDSLSATVKKLKEDDLRAISDRIQNFSATAQQQMQDKQAELLKPVFDKADKAVKAVAAEKGLIYVFDVSQGTRVVLYNNPKESLDLLPLVKTKLGIQ